MTTLLYAMNYKNVSKSITLGKLVLYEYDNPCDLQGDTYGHLKEWCFQIPFTNSYIVKLAKYETRCHTANYSLVSFVNLHIPMCVRFSVINKTSNTSEFILNLTSMRVTIIPLNYSDLRSGSVQTFALSSWNFWE